MQAMNFNLIYPLKVMPWVMYTKYLNRKIQKYDQAEHTGADPIGESLFLVVILHCFLQASHCDTSRS